MLGRRLLLLLVAGFCLTEYASSRPPCRGGTYDPTIKKCVYTREQCVSRGGTYNQLSRTCVFTSRRCASNYRWSSSQGRCVPSRRPDPAPAPPICPDNYSWDSKQGRCVHIVCPDNYRWDSRRERCMRIKRDTHPRPAPSPVPERGGDARVFKTTHYISEAASVTVTSTNNGIEYQKDVKGTAYVLIENHTDEPFNKTFDSVAEMKSYLIEHACKVDPTEEGMLVFKSDADNSSIKLLLSKKGSLSSKAKIQIEVSYHLHVPSSGIGHAYDRPTGRPHRHMRNMTIACS